MPSKDPSVQKALKDGLLTQKQYDKLPENLLKGIVKSKRKGNGKSKKPAGRQKGKDKKPRK